MVADAGASSAGAGEDGLVQARARGAAVRRRRATAASRALAPWGLTLALSLTAGCGAGNPRSEVSPTPSASAPAAAEGDPTDAVTPVPRASLPPELQRAGQGAARGLPGMPGLRKLRQMAEREATQSLAVAVRVVQANLYHGLAAGEFSQDLSRVAAYEPDFVTLNEVSNRSDATITPAGYAAWRGAGDRWTRETAVLWRTDSWTRVDAGTVLMHDRPVKWGRRLVNWVTLQDEEGYTVSVVAAHPSPLTRYTHGLLPQYLQRLGALVGQLAARGQVFVGGDFNVDYASGRFPGGAFARADLATTWATFGPPARGTGDYAGRTIDYLFYRRDPQVRPLQGGSFELASDHDGVYADFALTPFGA